MAFRFEETFQVRSDPDRVWAWLMDPERVVRCLPGAELTEILDETRFRGRMKVKVGPVSVAYQGEASFTDVDTDGRRVALTATGQEAKGPGSASMTMESVVDAGPEGGSVVRIAADVKVAGKIVQFGRGMIETVSTEIFRQFADCARTTLEAPETPGEAGDSGKGGVADGDGGPEPADAEPLRPVALLLRALKERLARLFGR